MDWDRCVGICTDGGRSMTGKHTGLIAHIKRVCPSISWLHCSIHREALAAKNMPADLLAVLNDAVKLVNFIKARPLNSRMFTLLCNEMGSEHKSLLLHTEVRWRSRGKGLFELRHELQQFLKSTGSQCNCVQHTRQGWGHDKEAMVLGELCEWEHTPVFPYASRVLGGK